MAWVPGTSRRLPGSAWIAAGVESWATRLVPARGQRVRSEVRRDQQGAVIGTVIAGAMVLVACSWPRKCDVGEGFRHGAEASIGIGFASQDGSIALAGLALAPVAAGGVALYCGASQLTPRPTGWWMSDAAIADLEKRAAAGEPSATAALVGYRGAAPALVARPR